MTGAVVITGASGFIGTALVAELARRDVQVTAVSRRSCDLPSDVAGAAVADYGETPARPDAVLVHLAENPGIDAAQAAGDAYVYEVGKRAQILLDKGYRRFVYMSSGLVYGTRDRSPHSPAASVEPGCVYAKAKLAVEEIVNRAGGAIIRLGNIYGPSPRPGTVLADILRQIPGAGPLKVKNEHPARDYLWFEDCVRGLADIALGAATGVFNLGTGVATSVGDMARMALEIAGETDRPVVSETTKRHGEIDAIALDVSATIAAFGWQPTKSLADGLRFLVRGRL